MTEYRDLTGENHFEGGATIVGYLDLTDAEIVGLPVDNMTIEYVNSLRVKDAGISTGKLKDGAVTEPKLANFAIGSDKLKDEAVIERVIADGAVSETKIQNGAVTEPKLADFAIGEDKLKDGAVSTAKIKDGAVTNVKITSVAASKVTGNFTDHKVFHAGAYFHPNSYIRGPIYWLAATSGVTGHLGDIRNADNAVQWHLTLTTDNHLRIGKAGSSYSTYQFRTNGDFRATTFNGFDLSILDGQVQQNLQDIGQLFSDLSDMGDLVENIRLDHDGRITANTNTINYLEPIITDHGDRILINESAITNLKGRMTTAEGDINGLEIRVTDLENVPSLEPRVSALEGDMIAVEGRLDIVEPKVSTLEGDMIAVENRLDIVEPKVSTLQSDMIAVEGRLDIVEPLVSKHEGWLDQSVKSTDTPSFNSIGLESVSSTPPYIAFIRGATPRFMWSDHAAGTTFGEYIIPDIGSGGVTRFVMSKDGNYNGDEIATKADNSVQLTGNQSIAGIKSFTSPTNFLASATFNSLAQFSNVRLPVAYLENNLGISITPSTNTIPFNTSPLAYQFVTGGFSWSTSNRRLTVPTTGLYNVSAAVYFATNNATQLNLYVTVNGALRLLERRLATKDNEYVTVSGVIRLDSTDYVSLQVRHNGSYSVVVGGNDIYRRTRLSLQLIYSNPL